MVVWAEPLRRKRWLKIRRTRRIGLTLPLHDDAYPHLIEHACVSSCAEHDLPVLVEEYATTTPPVTTISLRPDRVGDEAVDLLIALINARTGVDRRRVVQPVLVRRSSTRTPTLETSIPPVA